MRHFLTASMVISLGLLGCACGPKNAEPQKMPDENVQTTVVNAEAKPAQRDPDAAEGVNMDEFVHAATTERDFVDMSLFADEKIVEVTSKEVASSIKKDFWAAAKEKADPKTGALVDVKVPVHAVVYVKNSEDIELADRYFQEIGNVVTTFEIRISGEYLEPDSISLHVREDTHNRLMITGDGEEPASLGNIQISLSADVIQIRNLAWIGGDVSSRLVINPGRLFEASRIVMRDIEMDKDSEFRAEPLIVLESRADEGSNSQFAIRNSYFGNNAMPVILTFKEGASKRYDKAYFENVFLDGNKTRWTSFNISVEKDVEMKHVVVNHQNGAVFASKGVHPNIVKTGCDILEENILCAE